MSDLMQMWQQRAWKAESRVTELERQQNTKYWDVIRADNIKLNQCNTNLEAQLEQVDLARECLIVDKQKLKAKLDAVRKKVEGCCEYDSGDAARMVIRDIQAVVNGEDK